jgi:D-alanyl-lipoteichoic acid acyltransferase DltB (MBOAT superfamily)
VFYAFADWKILFLLILSTVVFYGLGIAIFQAKNDKQKSWFTTLGIVFGVGVLLYFKYTNFFIESFSALFENIWLQTNIHTFNIIVPIGISFYTFRLLSYVIDINRGKIKPTRDIVVFSTYVAFFPCILSGPIDRPATLIPQLQSKRIFNYTLAVDGLRQILWGLFKKIVIADNCAIYTNYVFSDYQTLSGSTLLIAAILYSFQVYTDFSGYSDMAIGIGKLLGFRLTRNFNYPFFAQNIADFWRRWHISLTSWLTDYVFMPLNVKWRDKGNAGMILAIVITFVICGLWHGANWTFVVFGFYHGLLFIPLILSGAMSKKITIEVYKGGYPKWKTLGKMLFTFGLVAVGLIVMRTETLEQGFEYLRGICNASLLDVPDFYKRTFFFPLLIWIPILLIVEWSQRNQQYGLETLGSNWNRPLRYSMYNILGIIISYYCLSGQTEKFIYFQF